MHQVGATLDDAESVLLLRVEVADQAGIFDGSVVLEVEGPQDRAPRGRHELKGGGVGQGRRHSQLEVVISARIQPGTYKLVAVHVGTGAAGAEASAERRLAGRRLSIPVNRVFVVPPRRLVHLGAYSIVLSRKDESNIATDVTRRESPRVIRLDLQRLQRSEPQLVKRMLERSQEVFAPRLKPLLTDAGKPPCPPREAGECARRCEASDVRSCYDLGDLYERGNGVPKDLARAVQLYDRACAAGYGAGCNDLALLYEHGKGVPKNPARAAALYLDGCNLEHFPACANLAWLHQGGRGVPRGLGRAAELYELACDGGAGRACNNLGWMYSAGGEFPADPTRAARLFKRSCDLQYDTGCSSFGWVLAQGIGVPRDVGGGGQLLRRGCVAGNGWGCDKLDAICQGGSAAACFTLSRLAAEGRGVGRDAARAGTLARKACELGDSSACGATPSGSPAPGPSQSGSTPPAPAALATAAAAPASVGQRNCAVVRALGNLRYTAVASSRGRSLAANRAQLLAELGRFDLALEPKLARLQRDLVRDVTRAPKATVPVGDADMAVSAASMKQLDQLVLLVQRSSARHGGDCAPADPVTRSGSKLRLGRDVVATVAARVWTGFDGQRPSKGTGAYWSGKMRFTQSGPLPGASLLVDGTQHYFLGEDKADAKIANFAKRGRHIEIVLNLTNPTKAEAAHTLWRKGAAELKARLDVAGQSVPLAAFLIPGVWFWRTSLATGWTGPLTVKLAPGGETWLLLAFEVPAGATAAQLRLGGAPPIKVSIAP
ncbi:MAG: sel1 repeat family protein [Deltaproteobacteria bacterium]|nr:sel1 repeat family protein [Deltaproteobacteria bacterium]